MGLSQFYPSIVLQRNDKTDTWSLYSVNKILNQIFAKLVIVSSPHCTHTFASGGNLERNLPDFVTTTHAQAQNMETKLGTSSANA